VGHDVRRCEHGTPEMYTLAGPFLCDRAVHAALSGAIYSKAGVQWWFVTEGDRDVLGFATLRDDGKAYWFDYGYVIPSRRGEGVFSALSEARAEYLRTLPGKPLRVVCKESRWSHYEARGWRTQSRRGSWVYGIHGEGVWT
jgi:GNAT superfamily N-acetyltransferase